MTPEENGPFTQIEQARPHAHGGARIISRRAYNAILAGTIVMGFVVMGTCAQLMMNPQFLIGFLQMGLVGVIGCFVAAIVGLVLMGSAKKRQSVAMSLVGYLLFVSTFGLITSIGMLSYSMTTISNALLATAAITGVFGILGVTFPHVFQKIAGVLTVSLLALIVVELVMMFMGVDQALIDVLVIIVFCGFIGYDSYVASYDEPTVPNAIFNASNLFLDILNVFVRLLDLFGRR